MPKFVTSEANDPEGWEKINEQVSYMSTAQSQLFVDSFESNMTSTNLGDVNVLDIKPANWANNGKILVYIHGAVIQF